MNKESVNLSANQGKLEFFEEKLLINAYHSSETLKDEIGKIIIHRSKLEWDFVNIVSRGPFICLVFKQKCN